MLRIRLRGPDGLPFSGVKESGWGPHEQGRAAIEFYSETVTGYQDAPLG